MVDPIGTSLAVLATVDLCVKYGKELVKKYEAFKNAEREISELILCVEDHWVKFEYRVQFLQSIWNSLDNRLQVHQHHLLQQLHLKLQEANDLLDGFIGTPVKKNNIESIIGKRGSTHRTRYAYSFEECVRRCEDDLKKWHDKFDLSWFLIARISCEKIDNGLNGEVIKDNESLLSLKGLRDAARAAQSEAVLGNGLSIWRAPDTLKSQRDDIPFSNVQIAQSHDSQHLLVDSIVPDAQANLSTTVKEIRDLARILSKSDPRIFGLLRCVGVINETPSLSESQPTKFQLLFAIPDGLRSPIALRTLLRSKEGNYSLNERLDLARCIASSVMYVHSSKFVHKNIRPETTIVFSNDGSQWAAPFLVGFEKFRPIDRWTYRKGDSIWEKGLYRHPSRQGLQPEEDYIMQHDIYSLGVLLLEIGLWTSFVEQDEHGKAIPGHMLDIGDLLKERNERKKAVAIKSTLINMAKTQLPSKMGQKYCSIVLACLTCLDKTNNGFGDEDEFVDEDGIVVAIRYIEKVLLRIYEISI